MSNDTLAWLRWVLIPEIGLKRAHQLLALVDSPQALFLHPDRWPLPDRIKTTIREMNLLGEQHPVHRKALEQLRWAELENNHLLTLTDSTYPDQLTQIYEAPLVLWARGQLSALAKPQIGMVGSRQASHRAMRHAAHISQRLAESDLTITSGGAKGIDAACHQATLDSNGSTIAILGCGVDIVYPKSNRLMFQNLTQSGLLLSEYSLGTPPRPGHFPRRNRLISGLSEVLIIIEASLKSGSLITAQHALEQGRDIFAMPGDIDNPNSDGCHRLIQDGAYLLSSADDILNHLKWQQNTRHTVHHDPLEGLSDVQRQIVNTLKTEQQPLDVLAHRLSLSVHQLLEPVLELELSGVIEQQPGGYILL
jgi:DNA processing protein